MNGNSNIGLFSLFIPKKCIRKFASNLTAKWNRQDTKNMPTIADRNHSLEPQLSATEMAHCHTDGLFPQKQGDDIGTPYFKQSLTHARTQTVWAPSERMWFGTVQTVSGSMQLNNWKVCVILGQWLSLYSHFVFFYKYIFRYNLRKLSPFGTFLTSVKLLNALLWAASFLIYSIHNSFYIFTTMMYIHIF